MCEAHEESSGDHAEKVRDTVEEVREDVNETITTALYARESLMELDKVLSSLRRAADELHTLVGPDQIDVSEMIRSNEPLPATLTQTGLQWGRVLDDAEMVARTTGDSVTGYEPVFERLLPLSIGYVAKVALFWS